jgi:HAD superfamily hydrolase (TIGR01509 family)
MSIATAVAAAVKTDFGVTLPANFFEDMGARIIAAYPGKLRPMDGIPELLAALKLKRCVASNSPIARVQQALTATGLMPHLEPHIYSAAMVARSKPAPDLYLYAAERHGVRPERCLVIEDSLSGVEAGRAAGMRVIGFVGGSHCRPGHADAMRDAGCVEVFSRMGEVAEFLVGTSRPQRQIVLNKIRRAYRRSAFPIDLSSARLIYAVSIGVIVGIGMAFFAPFVDQSPLLLRSGSGVAAFLLMLFVT